MNSAKSWSMSAPMAFCISFASVVSAWIARSCSTGSSRSVRAARTNIVATWFVTSCSLAVDRHRHAADQAVRREGRRGAIQVLAASGVHAASTTSLTVVPNADLIVAHVVERGLAERDRAMRGDARPLNFVRGADERRAPSTAVLSVAWAAATMLRATTDRRRPSASASRSGSAIRACSACDELDVGRQTPRVPGLFRRLRIGRVRLEVEQVDHQVRAGDAVDRRVVHLRDDGDRAVFETLDEPHLPQRTAAVERAAGDVADDLGQLVHRARRAARRCDGGGRRDRSRGPRSTPGGRGRTGPAPGGGGTAGADAAGLHQWRTLRRTRSPPGIGRVEDERAHDVHVRVGVSM